MKRGLQWKVYSKAISLSSEEDSPLSLPAPIQIFCQATLIRVLHYGRPHASGVASQSNTPINIGSDLTPANERVFGPEEYGSKHWEKF